MEPVRSLAGAQAEADAAGNQQPSPVYPLTSKKVSDHLANERTFLAWVRTGTAVTAFGFVIEHFGLLVRELGLKVGHSSNSSLLSSKGRGIVVPMLGILMLVAALFHFVQVRRTIEKEHYQPGLLFPIVLTCFAALIVLLVAIYLTTAT